ncbi:LacI family DNA-binding transcriptional regulator [Atopococcus tabaci]|uniref:LacI family DNA-binding transcriptional regulator n=1 Tax=Atopococcus tabaci TaxID=269774 RepID=UPI000415CE00|nr:LacI family DNA-binding transcriptional regulator [Atopococcus tabaci]
MVTIADIAKQAGVAKSTVSRYLNGGSVSEKTRRKIQQIIEETGYEPNTFARSLKAHNTNMIGVIIPRLSSSSSSEVLTGIDHAARKMGYQLIITNADLKPQREIENIYTLAKQKVAGIIFMAREISTEHQKAIESIEIPVLVLGQEVEGIHTIVHADYKAGYSMGEYALKAGHRSFLYFGVPEEDKSVGMDRKQGFLDAVSQEKVSVEVVETSFSMEKAYRDVLRVLPKLKATYVACATDMMAMAVLKAAKEIGFSIPESFSLSGFGGYDTVAYLSPSLTTVVYPFQQLGELAVSHIDKLLKGQPVPEHTEMENELSVRESTRTMK